MSNEHGFIVLRTGVDNRTPVRVGDDVVTYELGEPWPYHNLPPHGHTRELLEYETAVLAHANSENDWRVQDVLRCTCKAGRVVAQVLVHIPSARLWATAKPERVPTAFRAPDSGAVHGWALHGSNDEAPHLGGVASCGGCRRRWLVVSFADHATILSVRAATHGARVTP